MRSGMPRASFGTASQEAARHRFHGRGGRSKANHVSLKTVDELGGTINLRTAQKIATEMATGLLAHLYNRIDPIYFPEARRAMSIAGDHGSSLLAKDQNIEESESGLILSDYPSHGYVIDREEAGASHNRWPGGCETLSRSDRLAPRIRQTLLCFVDPGFEGRELQSLNPNSRDATSCEQALETDGRKACLRKRKQTHRIRCGLKDAEPGGCIPYFLVEKGQASLAESRQLPSARHQTLQCKQTLSGPPRLEDLSRCRLAK